MFNPDCPRIVGETERMLLREVSLSDDAFMLALLNQASFITHIADRGVRDVAAARQYIETKIWAGYATHGFGMWVMQRRSDGAALGLCGLVRRDWLPDADVGYALLDAHVRQGYTLEAARAVVAYGRRALGMRRLLGITSPTNTASKALLMRLGMVEQGLVQAPDSPEPTVLFSLDDTERG